jgi:hypothetical protein
MNAKQKARWLEMRAKGRGRFILQQGILKIGGTYALLSLVITYISKYGFTTSKVSEYGWNVETIFKLFFDWVFFGFFMGLFFWYFGEREFRKQDKNKI